VLTPERGHSSGRASGSNSPCAPPGGAARAACNQRTSPYSSGPSRRRLRAAGARVPAADESKPAAAGPRSDRRPDSPPESGSWSAAKRSSVRSGCGGERSMVDRHTAAAKPNDRGGPPTDRFVGGWPPPGIPATGPALALRPRPSRAYRGATAATALRPDGPSENHPPRRRVRSTDGLGHVVN
jgi:hypothetical protein